ncbi:MAG TPA: hypothetical protein VFA46_12705 [Actinomycetes bacterium]|nr:hypothetical protein [Actinomycetes bacterium]
MTTMPLEEIAATAAAYDQAAEAYAARWASLETVMPAQLERLAATLTS